MANMSYVRFENTLEDLNDCYRHMGDEPETSSEKKKRIQLIELCVNIADDYGDEIED